MFKHIILQAIFQLVVLLILIFSGDLWIPEYSDSFDSVIGSNLQAKYANGIVSNGVGVVRSGRFNFINGGNDYYNVFNMYGTYSRHFTFIFNTFVCMQVFNFLNSRKLNDEVHSVSNLV